MLAAVTTSPGVMVVDKVPEPGPPGPRDVIVRPEAVGICGSDLHFYTGDTGALSGARSVFPRIQGHEFSAVVEQPGQDAFPQPGGGFLGSGHKTVRPALARDTSPAGNLTIASPGVLTKVVYSSGAGHGSASRLARVGSRTA